MKNKTFYLAIASLILLFAFTSLSSAYPYYAYPYDDNYDRYSYTSTRTSGRYGSYQIAITYFDRTSENYWDGRDYVKRTTYSYTTRESPRYDGYYYDYSPWYQKYWRTYPRSYYYYDYSPRYYYRDP